MSDFQARLQAALGAQYQLDRELGGGGMSRVFLADEAALGRKVVIKVLPPEMTSGVNQDRFRREVQLAARLQHPHIVPLLAAGAAEDLLWYVMPFIEGESLRAKLSKGGELPVNETIRILREVIDALAYAHGQGVVHRDIKPDNVLLSGRHALVTDFGVAKAVSESTGSGALTSLGLALGTPAYMAPEQASAEPNVDQRADLYALGAMAYEMLVGQPPFSGLSAQAVLAAHLTKQAPTVTSQRAAVPPALDALIMRCLEKRPADRWQSAEELLPQLDAMLNSGSTTPMPAHTTTISSGTEAALRRGHPVRVGVVFGVAAVLVLVATNLLVNKLGLPSWVLTSAVVLLLVGLPIVLATSVRERKRLLARNTGAAKAGESGLGRLLTWRRAFAGGGIAFAGLIAGAGAFMALRVAGVGPFATLLSAGVIKARDPLVMADFENRTSDSTLAQSVTEALRIDLSRSPLVHLLETSDITETLRRMEKDPATPLSGTVAREVAERAGAAAVVTGEIAPLGSGFVLSARLIGTKDGATLLAVRETADGAGGLIAAVDKLSKKLREGIGESLRTIRGGEPLEDVTTRSLEALRKYSQAERAADQGEDPRAIALIKDAIRLDSGFAMAYRKLAVLLNNTAGSTSEQATAMRKAFELRERLPEREKLLATAYYYWILDYNSDKVIEAYRQVLETWPEDNTAANNLAIELNTRGRYAEAIAVLEPAIVHSPQVGVLHVNLIEVLTAMGQFARADTAMAQWAAVQPTSGIRYSTGFRYSFGKGDYDAALAYADSAALRGNPVIQARGHHQRANVYRIRGQLARAEQEEFAEAEINRQTGSIRQQMMSAADLALGNILLRGKPEVGEKILDSLVATFAKSGADPADLPYLAVSDGYARAGAVAKAERVLAEYEQKIPEALKNSDTQRPYTTGVVALAKGQYAAALAGLRDARVKNGGVITALTEIGQAFEGMRQSDSALAAYEGFANQPDVGPAFRQYLLPVTLRHLGELYEARNNKDKALEVYGRFVALWKNADTDLQPQVQEVKRRMAVLAGEPGRGAAIKP